MSIGDLMRIISDEGAHDESDDVRNQTARRIQRIRDEFEYDSNDSLKKRIVAKVRMSRSNA
jgi:hypothetical protein